MNALAIFCASILALFILPLDQGLALQYLPWLQSFNAHEDAVLMLVYASLGGLIAAILHEQPQRRWLCLSIAAWGISVDAFSQYYLPNRPLDLGGLGLRYAGLFGAAVLVTSTAKWIDKKDQHTRL